ncbi:class I SAM-dependent methyltransferase, partial [Patescibacteria group bacterium]|nr:class I SAM-dependent methyltransferase [Patescibacteria group bacterium]
LKIAKEKGFNVQSFDLNSPVTLSEKYDVAFLSQILEHVDSPINLLRFVNGSLKKGSKVIISVPNELSIIHFKYPYFKEDGNHLYSFSITNMKELLIEAGFNLEKTYFDYYTSLTNKLKIDRHLKFFDRFPVWFRYPFAWSFWFVGEKI